MTHHTDIEPVENISADTTPEQQARRAARKRIEKRRNLEGGFVAYAVVNAGLIAIWALSGGGYFWPGWVMAAWGIGMILGLCDYLRKPVTDADVEAEVRKIQSRGW
jgi:2TM domain-containing protein